MIASISKNINVIRKTTDGYVQLFPNYCDSVCFEVKDKKEAGNDTQSQHFRVVFKDGTVICAASPVEIGVYAMQYGVCVNKDRLLIPSWEKGLYCINLSDLTINWLFKKKHAANIVETENSVIVYCRNDGIYRLTKENGEIIQRVPLSNDALFFVLDKSYALYGPVRKCFYLLSLDTMATVKCFDERIFAESIKTEVSNRYAILNAVLVGNQIILSGYYHKNNEIVPFIQTFMCEKTIKQIHTTNK